MNHTAPSPLSLSDHIPPVPLQTLRPLCAGQLFIRLPAASHQLTALGDLRDLSQLADRLVLATPPAGSRDHPRTNQLAPLMGDGAHADSVVSNWKECLADLANCTLC